MPLQTLSRMLSRTVLNEYSLGTYKSMWPRIPMVIYKPYCYLLLLRLLLILIHSVIGCGLPINYVITYIMRIM